MNKECADRVATLLEEAIGNIGQALHVMMEQAPTSEYEEFRLKSADIVGNIALYLIDPIYAQFPELEPEAYKDKQQLWCHYEPPK